MAVVKYYFRVSIRLEVVSAFILSARVASYLHWHYWHFPPSLQSGLISRKEAEELHSNRAKKQLPLSVVMSLKSLSPQWRSLSWGWIGQLCIHMWTSIPPQKPTLSVSPAPYSNKAYHMVGWSVVPRKKTCSKALKKNKKAILQTRSTSC